MYLVTYKEFVQYLKDEDIKQDKVVLTEIPCIVQYMRGDIVKAKIEVVEESAFKWNEKYGLKTFKESKNKYWIRGKEWA